MNGSKSFKQILEKVVRFSQTHHLLPEGEALAVACSGGPDSVALLHILSRLARRRKLRLHVFHFDHRLRSTSRHDVRFVADLCQSLEIPFHLGRWTFAERNSENELPHSQAEARKARYQFFHRKASELGIRWLALGHHADDQVETFFWRLLRQSAPSGLVGIRPRALLRGAPGLRLVRPLLAVTRAEIESLLKEAGLGFRTDPSNSSRSYLRNRIRIDLLPLLSEQYQPRIRQHVLDLSLVLHREDQGLWKALSTWMQKRRVRGHRLRGGGMRFDRGHLQHCPAALRLRLALWMVETAAGATYGEVKLRHLTALEAQARARESSQLALPRGWSVEIKGKWVTFRPKPINSPLAKTASFR